MCLHRKGGGNLARGKAYSLNDMKLLAIEKNGECISSEYKNINTKLLWICEKKHEWEATPKSLLQGSWCRKCSTGSRKLTIQEMKLLALEKGGECLSEVYTDFHSNLVWKCGCGFVWETPPSYIKNSNAWCPKCASVKRNEKLCIYQQKRTMEHANKFVEFIEAKGGRILSEYSGTNIKIKIECENGHVWEARPSNLKKRVASWCPTCYKLNQGNLNRIYSINDAREYAESRGGYCRSKEYKNDTESLIWECNFGHVWNAPFTRVKRGSWCPQCNIFVGEEKVRYIFQALFKERFIKTRQVLGESKLELDGFNEDLGIAFEHQGEQHYKFIEFYHRTESGFKKQLKKDEIKKQIAMEKGITLIEIPYYISNQENEELINFIIKELNSKGIQALYEVKDVDFSSIYTLSPLYQKILELARTNGVEILSKEYLVSGSKVEWECKKGHYVISGALAFMKNKATCRKCIKEVHDNKKLTEIALIAENKNGKCLSDSYLNAHEPLLFECQYKHQWYAPYNRVKKLHWCPTCVREERENKKDNLGRYK